MAEDSMERADGDCPSEQLAPPPTASDNPHLTPPRVSPTASWEVPRLTSAARAFAEAKAVPRLQSLNSNLGEKSSFYKADSQVYGKQDFESPGETLINHPAPQSLMVVVTLFDMVLICQAANSRAMGEPTPTWVAVASVLILVVYLLELVVRAYVLRARVFMSGWNWLDFVVIVISVIQEASHEASLNIFRLVRLCRLLRLLRLFRMIRTFDSLQELKKLMAMMSSCLRTLAWSFALFFLLLNVWSVAAVELIHPVVMELSDAGHWEDCERCSRAFASVLQADVTFFATIVAGDSWGLMAIPVMEHTPLTSILFFGSLFTITYGLLQLIICVIVDSFAETRNRDFFQKARERADHEGRVKKELIALFDRIDEDGSGNLSLEELQAGALSVPEFAERLTAMDIGKTDLEDLFQLLDKDGSGDIELDEFVEVLYRMMNADSVSGLTFIRQMVRDMMQKQEAFAKDLDDKVKTMQETVDKKRRSLAKMHGIAATLEHKANERSHQEQDTQALALQASLRSEDHESKAAFRSEESKETLRDVLLEFSRSFGKSSKPGTPRHGHGKKPEQKPGLEQSLESRVLEDVMADTKHEMEHILRNKMIEAVQKSVEEALTTSIEAAFSSARERLTPRNSEVSCQKAASKAAGGAGPGVHGTSAQKQPACARAPGTSPGPTTSCLEEFNKLDSGCRTPPTGSGGASAPPSPQTSLWRDANSFASQRHSNLEDDSPKTHTAGGRSTQGGVQAHTAGRLSTQVEDEQAEREADVVTMQISRMRA